MASPDAEQQTFPAATVRALLRKAQAVRNLTGDGPDGWLESNVDPAERSGALLRGCASSLDALCWAKSTVLGATGMESCSPSHQG